MVELDEVPLAAAGPDTIPDTGLAIGKTIRQSVTKGETLGYSFFVSSGVETNVTDGLPRGLRAMAVQVSQVTGVGTLIQNGDHVDVVISMKIQNVIPDPVNKGQVIKVGTGSVRQDGPPERAGRRHAAAAADGSNAQPSPTPAQQRSVNTQCRQNSCLGTLLPLAAPASARRPRRRRPPARPSQRRHRGRRPASTASPRW